MRIMIKEEVNKYKYLIMLSLNIKELEEYYKEYGADIMSEYIESLKKLREVEEFKPIYTKEEDERRIRNSEKILGYEEGLEQEKMQTAINFYKNGVDIDIILKSTGLIKEKFDEIIANKNND